ncbi:hypothetical protein [Edaphobacter aggregans]|uniref:hypothetical protein n=1 Tax=Edaphobacter aggregans TaxID=570835 RepID=UPI0012F8D18C|nr:hypothetical protein [Edaphobacter aggregans]
MTEQSNLHAKKRFHEIAPKIRIFGGSNETGSTSEQREAISTLCKVNNSIGNTEWRYSSWGMYPKGIQRSIAAGVKGIEHGQLMDGATAKLIA